MRLNKTAWAVTTVHVPFAELHDVKQPAGDGRVRGGAVAPRVLDDVLVDLPVLEPVPPHLVIHGVGGLLVVGA